MIRQQRRKLERNKLKERILSEGVYECLNGETFEYKVTNLDELRREFTGSPKLVEGLRNGTIEPFEISRLLEQLHGKLETS